MPGPSNAARRRQQAQFHYQVELDHGQAGPRRAYLVQCCEIWLTMRFPPQTWKVETRPYFAWDRMTMKMEQISVYGFRQPEDAAAFKVFGMSLDAMSEKELVNLTSLLRARFNVLKPKEANPPPINCGAV